ncbi:hypothetical protein BDW_09625 [Bdellovibrio bacteriovorus W]|nr:hypothetical protein BDW_09625 [Bdellovibrio bacteriovorus W]
MNIGTFQVLLALLMIISSSAVNAETVQSKLYREVTLQHKSECRDGDKRNRVEAVNIPLDAVLAFDRVEYEVYKDKGNAWKSSSYDPVSRTVLMKVESQAHDECFQVGGVWVRENTSSIHVKFKIYVLENACDPLARIPDLNTQNAADYVRDSELQIRKEKCELELLKIKKNHAVSKIKEVVLDKAKARSSQNDLIRSSQVSQLKLMKDHLEKLRRNFLEKSKQLNLLPKKLESLHLTVHPILDFYSSEFYVESNIEKYAKALNDLFGPENAQLRKIREALTGRKDGLPQLPPAMSFFNLDEWKVRVEKSRDDSFAEYTKQLRFIEEFEASHAVDIQRLQNYFVKDDISFAIGIASVKNELGLYKAKVEEITRSVFENQEQLRDLQNLHTRFLNKMLCEKYASEKYCKENFTWHSPFTSPYEPYPHSGGGVLTPKIPPKDIGPRPFPSPFPRGGAGKLYSMPVKTLSGATAAFSELSAQNALSGEVCFTMQTEVSPNSNLDAGPQRPGLHFLSINGIGVPFYEDASKTRYYQNQKILALSKGCIQRGYLRVGTNSITISYLFGDGSQLQGSHSTVFYVNYGSAHQRTVCQASSSGVTTGVYACNRTMNLDLEQIDPEFKRQIEGMKTEVIKLKQDALKVNTQLDEALALLKKYERINFDQMDSNEIARISEELQEVAMLIDEIRLEQATTVKEMQQAIAQTISMMRTPEEALKEVLGKDYQYEKDQILAEWVLPNFKIIEAKLAASYSNDKGETLAKEVITSYDKMYDEVSRSLEKAVHQKNYLKADEILDSWAATKGYLLQKLKDRKAGPREVQAFQNFSASVDQFVSKYFDKDGFALSAKIPLDIRTSITAAKSSFAKKIKIAMNKNDDGMLSDLQKKNQGNFYQVLRGYADVFGYDKQEDTQRGVNAQVRGEVESGLLKMAEAGFRFGVSFTPAGKFLDFCELVTGRSLCLPEGEILSTTDRALSGLGIVLGSGTLLKSVAKSSVIKDSKVVEASMMFANEALQRLKKPMQIVGDRIFETGSKLLKMFKPVSREITDAQLILRSEEKLLDTLRSFEKYDFLDPAALNRAVADKVGPGAFDAFDKSLGAMKGVLSKEKKFVRVLRYEEGSKRSYVGEWMVPEEILRGLSPERIKDVLQITQVPTHYSLVTVPKGASVITGRIANNTGKGVRELMQIWIPDLSSSAVKVDFQIPKPIGNVFK